MDLSRIEKKLREAEFFLSHLKRREQYPLGDAEVLDFLLSAFLNAARTIHYRLCHEQEKRYKDWRKLWDEKIDPSDRLLVKFIDEDRVSEVHKSGSGRTEKLSPMGVHMEGGEVVGFVTLPAPRPGAIAKTDFFYSLSLEGQEKRATDVCDRYVVLMKEMLAAYQAV